jgi:hypothetical protein
MRAPRSTEWASERITRARDRTSPISSPSRGVDPARSPGRRPYTARAPRSDPVKSAGSSDRCRSNMTRGECRENPSCFSDTDTKNRQCNCPAFPVKRIKYATPWPSSPGVHRATHSDQGGRIKLAPSQARLLIHDAKAPRHNKLSALELAEASRRAQSRRNIVKLF